MNKAPRLFSVLFLFLFFYSHAQPTIGLQIGASYRKQMPKDVEGTLKKVHDLGIRDLEGGGTYNLTKEAYKSLLDKYDLKIVSLGTSLDSLEKNPQAVAEKALFFGAKYVICYWIPHNKDTFTIADAQRGVAVFNAAGKILKEKGLQLQYHAHGYEFQPFENGTFFDYMVNNMDPEFANFQMDVFWFRNSGQDPVAFLKKYPNRFISLHLKDRKHGSPNNVTAKADVESNVVLGTGDVDIAAVLAQAKKNGIKYAFIEDESSRSEEQVPQSLAFLRSLK
jgi:sugar phosphate isomerase/epimerase